MAVYDALARNADPVTGEVSLSLTDLSAMTWYERPWICRVLRRLRDDGAVEVVKPGDPKKNRATVYRVPT